MQLGSRYSDLVVLDGDVKNSTKTEGFAKQLPERFVEGQIAEQNLFGAAVGLAASGKRPCIATFAAFVTRAARRRSSTPPTRSSTSAAARPSTPATTTR